MPSGGVTVQGNVKRMAEVDCSAFWSNCICMAYKNHILQMLDLLLIKVENLHGPKDMAGLGVYCILEEVGHECNS